MWMYHLLMALLDVRIFNSYSQGTMTITQYIYNRNLGPRFSLGQVITYTFQPKYDLRIYSVAMAFSQPRIEMVKGEGMPEI